MGRRIGIGCLALWLGMSACGSGDPGPSDGPGSLCEQDRDCDDDIDCTRDTCAAGAGGVRRCEHVPRNTECAANEECVVSSALGSGCRSRAALWCAGLDDGDPCLPGDACSDGSGTCREGVCEYRTRTCAERRCQIPAGCDPGTGECTYLPAPDGTACDRDGDHCTADLCHEGVCEEGVFTCECSPRRSCPTPANPCLGIPACEDNSCISHPVICEPSGNPCRENACDPATGTCLIRDSQDGTPCPDDLECTVDEACLAGRCVAQERICEPRTCLLGTCLEPEGCEYEAILDGTPCDDNDLCNGQDACLAGACTPVGGPDCDDGLSCTADSCDRTTGLCVHVQIMDCCGNGIIEDGEDCDPGPHPVHGCNACAFAVATVARNGFGPSVAWMPHGGSGWILSERIVQSLGYQVELREVSANGTFGPAFPVSDPVVRTRWSWPAMAALQSNTLLVAFHEEDHIELRLLDDTGGMLRSRALAVPDGVVLPETGRIVLVPTSTGAIMAFETEDDTSRILWMLTIQADPAGLVPGVPVRLATSGTNRDMPLLGGGCAGDGRIILAFRIDDPDYPVEQTIGVFDQADLARPSVRYLGPAGPLSLPVLACVHAGPGRFLLVHEEMSGDPNPGFRLVSRIVDLDGMDVADPDGPTLPTLLASGRDVEQDVYVWRYLPNFLALVALPGERFLLGATFGPGRFVSEPDALAFRLAVLDRDGIPTDSFVPLPGQGGPFSFSLALSVRPDGIPLAAWTEGDNMLQYFQGGTNRARFLRLP